MICPSCADDIDPIGMDIVPPLGICPSCERSLVVMDGSARLAKAEDVQHITLEQKTALMQLRVATRKARRAYYEQHHAH